MTVIWKEWPFQVKKIPNKMSNSCHARVIDKKTSFPVSVAHQKIMSPNVLISNMHVGILIFSKIVVLFSEFQKWICSIKSK